MWEHALVFAIFAFCLWLAGRHVYRAFTAQGGGCGCGSACPAAQKREDHPAPQASPPSQQPLRFVPRESVHVVRQDS